MRTRESSGSNKLEEYGQGEHLGGDVTREKIQFSVRTGAEHWIHGIKIIKIGNTSFSLFTFFYSIFNFQTRRDNFLK